MSIEASDHFKARVLQCHACKEKERAERDFTSDKHDGDGVYYVVEPIKPQPLRGTHP